MAQAIRVILKETVKNLGSSGDVARVRPGYARNFLLPRGLAIPATDANLSRVDELKRAALAVASKARAEADELARQIGAVTVTLARAVGDDERMYGSVTSKDVEEAYERAGVKIDRRKITLAAPIRALGEFQLPIRLHPEVMAELKVVVTKK
ncbi:MAG: 50S ribosomal protein L9 [Polyangiaceae bacterium]|nr:50S ribosomal protein L9 [Polyangiaceae bacterium]